MNIYIKKIDQTFPVDFDGLDKHVQDYIINYGLKQTLADIHAGVTDTAKAHQLVVDKISDFERGILPSSGGSSVSALTVELRNIVASLLKQIGHKSAEAKKLAKDPQKGLKLVIYAAVATKLGIPRKEVNHADVEAAAERNMIKLVTQAKATIAARATTIDIEI